MFSRVKKGKENCNYMQYLVKIMSWYNPTSEEASEAYSYYKNKYYDAANQRNASIRQEQSYISEKNIATTKLKDLSSQKINFEKRLEGIENIIKMLEGSGGWFSTNVPNTISKATSSIQKADTSYRRSIKMSGGVAAASLETAFSIKTVEGDAFSSSALQTYKSEKSKLEQSIANLRSQIASLSSQISVLSQQISACSSTQASLQSIMYSSAYEMNHYKRYMN